MLILMMKRDSGFILLIIDHIKNKLNKEIELHVLSTSESQKTKCYKISKESRFPIYIHSLKNLDGDKFLNTMKVKISTNQELTKKELLLLSLLCFTKTQKNTSQTIYDSATTITNIKDLDEDIGQFVKGVLLMLCDKFVTDRDLNIKISNLVGSNMKIVEEYAERLAEKEKENGIKIGLEKGRKEERKKALEEAEKKEKQYILRLNHIGVGIKDITQCLDVSEDYVRKIISN